MDPQPPAIPPKSTTARCLALAIALAALLALAAFTDVRIANWAHANDRWDLVKHSPFALLIKFPGTFYYTLCLAVALAAWWKHRARPDWRRPPAILLLSGALAGLAYALAKWCVGRTRPFKGVGPFDFAPFHNGLKGLFVAENQAFPSGHACIAFATAAAIAPLLPRRFAWPFFVIAAIVGLERILENAHYPSDVVAGAILGIIAGALAHRIIDRYLTRLAGSGRQGH